MQVRGGVFYGTGEGGVHRSTPGAIPMSQLGYEANSTAGPSTLTASSLLVGIINRTGGGGAGFTDTLPTVNALIAAAPHLSVGDSFSFLMWNNATGQTGTLAAGTGWTLAGTTTYATAKVREYLVQITANKPTRILNGASTTNGSAVVTGLSDDDCKNIMPGMVVSGTGIAGATTILAVNADTNSMVLSANATATNSPIALTCDPAATCNGVRLSDA